MSSNTFRKTRSQRIADLPSHLRGLPQNRWGGHNTQKIRGFRGTTYGALPCRQFSEEEIRELERQMRLDKRL
jgi:hypothetical protein